jgi:hypothetical protein
MTWPSVLLSWICWTYCSYLDGDSFTNCFAGVTMNCLVYCECQLECGTIMCECFQIMCLLLHNFSLSQMNASDLWSVLGERTGLLAHHRNFDVLLCTLSVFELSKIRLLTPASHFPSSGGYATFSIHASPGLPDHSYILFPSLLERWNSIYPTYDKIRFQTLSLLWMDLVEYRVPVRTC